MKIYKIVSNVSDYQRIMPTDDSEYSNTLSFDCETKEEVWNPIDMYVFNSKKKKGNFYSLGGIGALAFDEKVLDIMQTIFEMAGEILPVNVGKEVLYILNVLECVNALDDSNTKFSIYPDGTRGRILSYSFHADRISESCLYKIPETSKVDVLTYSGIKDPEDEFYSLYFEHKLKGLIFEEIYSQ